MKMMIYIFTVMIRTALSSEIFPNVYYSLLRHVTEGAIFIVPAGKTQNMTKRKRSMMEQR
jgi:hypothetical protein